MPMSSKFELERFGGCVKGHLRQPNPALQPTSLPPGTFPSTCGRVLGGKAAAELVRSQTKS